MIDMHNHVLYGVDDGAECLEDSLAMLAEAARVGYTGVVLTPHYMVYQDYTATVRENQVRLAHLERALDEAGIPITLYLGTSPRAESRRTSGWHRSAGPIRWSASRS